MSTRPLLTLVVATLGRREELSAFLASVPRALEKEVRVLVVDQNQDGFLGEEMAAAAQGLVITHLRVSCRHASRARNAGAMYASTDWIAFPDDDCRLLDRTLVAALPLMSGDALDLISGTIVDDDGHPHLLDWLSHEAPITRKNLDRTFVESSFFIRRELFLAAGGFDPIFGPGAIFESGEGADLVRRIWCGSPHLRARFVPAITIYHPDKEQEWTETSRCRIYRFARGEGALTARHWKGLPLHRLAKKMILRAIGACLSAGEKRRRKVAYLKGFFNGLQAYRSEHGA